MQGETYDPGADDRPLCLRYRTDGVTLGERQVLHQVRLALPQGVTALVGVNGAGKTTLIRSLVGLVGPASVRLERPGEVLDLAERRHAYLARVGWLPQEVSFPAGATGLDIVTYAGWLKGMRRREAAVAAAAALDAVHLSARSHDAYARLSAGMRRRVALAAALVHPSDVLLLDEPTAGLDPVEVDGFFRLVEEVRDRVVLLSTHVLDDVISLARDVVVLDAGRIVWQQAVAQTSTAVLRRRLLDLLRRGEAVEP